MTLEKDGLVNRVDLTDELWNNMTEKTWFKLFRILDRSFLDRSPNG